AVGETADAMTLVSCLYPSETRGCEPESSGKSLRPSLVFAHARMPRLGFLALLGGCASMPTGQGEKDTRPPPVVARTLQGDPVATSIAGSRIDRVEHTKTSTPFTVVPALPDAHGHVVGLGIDLVRVDLRGCRSPEDCASRTREMLAKVPAGSWIRGR